ncbi:hypothetical protein pipiens_013554 [Culex pipiens pipiens]|uniref:Uncharacterized protein n=1 Tax=Culex pipiens pipiens TaxID=38569 RepID=A0ABD1CY71_CULPP
MFLSLQDPFFDDIGVKSLNYLDTLFQRDNQEKAKFYKEFVSPTMIPFVLPNVFSIAKLCNQAEFEKHIFVHLKSIMSLQEPVQILLIFMQNMELMLKLTSPNDVKIR